MITTDYQVKGGLRTYGRQLQRSRLTAKLDAPGNAPKQIPSENVSISQEGRQRLNMEQLADRGKEPTDNPGADEDRP